MAGKRAIRESNFAGVHAHQRKFLVTGIRSVRHGIRLRQTDIGEIRRKEIQGRRLG
jgi:hypothetical protein